LKINGETDAGGADANHPIARDDERPLPDARLNVAGRAGGK
jgi:hypothetical protein